MAFRRKEDTSGGEQFKFENINQSLTGFYLGSFEHVGDFGPTKKHLFKTSKGIKVVFGQAHLTSLLAGESIGSLMRVTFTGEKRTKKGSPMKEYSLEIDDTQKLAPSELPDTEAEDGATESDEWDGPAEDLNEEDETPMDEVKAPVAKNAATRSAAPAESPVPKSRIQELLAKRKK